MKSGRSITGHVKNGFGKSIGALLMVLMLNALGFSTEVQAPKSQKESIDFMFYVFQNRRSVRKFKSTPVPEEHLLKILDAARCAPTSGNQQPWKFLVIRSREKLDLLKTKCIKKSMERARTRQNPVPEETKKRITQYFTDYLSAPVYVVVLTDNNSKYPTYNIHDGPLAAGYLMLAARALGYGTVYATDSIPVDLTKEVFNIPDHYTRVCITPIGVPEKWPVKKGKKKLADFIVYDTFKK
jgi:nitroreductase